MKSNILVTVQFIIMFLMILPFGAPIQNFALGMFFVGVGVLVGVLALYKNHFSNFNIGPEIKKNASLITDGIYGYIRHPMYVSVLLIMLGVLVWYANIYELVLYILLVINMLVKMFYEESLWKAKGDEYKEYSKETSMLIPFKWFPKKLS